jgi:hypothetical protein
MLACPGWHEKIHGVWHDYGIALKEYGGKSQMSVKKVFNYWIVALLILAFITACQSAPATAPPAPQPTSPPTQPPAATPVPPTVQGGFQPLSAAACGDLAKAMAQTLGVEVATAEAPFQDYITGQSGSGCQVTATGTGRDFESFVTVADALREVLKAQEWSEDAMYAADGPTGTASGFRKAGGLCLLSVGWEPADDAECPQDQPISECKLAPEQQLYSIVLNCAQTT